MHHVGRSTGDRTARWRWPLAVAALALLSIAALGDPIPESQAASDGGAAESPAIGEPMASSSTTRADAASTTSTPSSTASTVVAPRRPITLGFAGDTSFTHGLDSRDPFAEVGELLSVPDLMVVNLETAVADPGVGRVFVDKDFLFRSPPASLDLVVDAGIDAVVLANNHALDFGPEALAQTLREVDGMGLYRVGAGMTADEAYQPLSVGVGDWTVGLGRLEPGAV